MPNPTPLRLLVITSRPLIDSQKRPVILLDVEEERRRVREALQNAGAAIHAHFLPEATTGATTESLAQDWDVVHLTGHGSRDGRLWFEDEFGVAYPIDARDVAQMFGRHIPRVFVLSLCYSGKALPETLLNAGVRAVIAIDADEPIPDHAATLFNGTFYKLLAQGETMRQAFERAQTRVRLDPRVGDDSPLSLGEGSGVRVSQRFTLEGDGAFAFSSQAGAYEETGAPRALGNLRTRNRNFVGRAKEIVEIVTALDARGSSQNARRVAVWGSGGLGKTELAQAVAWWYAERGRVDAVLWASASPAEDVYVLRDLDSLLAIAARALKLNFSEKMPFDEQKAIVRDAFAKQETLLLLDNYETLVDTEKAREVWNFVLDLPSSVRVLVTSRIDLPSKDAANIQLETLTSADAAKLFLQITHNTGYFQNNPRLSQQQMAMLNDIIGRLGGYPLAIEVVAGQTKSRPLDEIWRDVIQFPKNVMEGKTEFGEPRGVWTSLGLSYNVLPDAEKEMFCRMSVFLAPATDEDIAAITQIPNPRTTLDTLVRRSLVRFREGYYSLLSIVRDYADSKLKERGYDPTKPHGLAILYYGEKGTTEGELIATEHMFEAATHFGLRFAAEGFLKYVPMIYEDLIKRGYWSDARRKTEQMIMIAQLLGEKQTEAEWIGQLGNRYQDIGEYERAAILHRQARTLHEAFKDKRGVAVALTQLGTAARDQGNYDEADRLYSEALGLWRETDDRDGIANALGNLGIVAHLRGNHNQAVNLYQESLKLHQELDDKEGIAANLGQLGMLARERGDYLGAKGLYQESLSVKEAVGDKNAIATSTFALGLLAQDNGDFAEAKLLYNRSLQTSREIGNKLGFATVLGQLAKLAREELNYAESEQLVQQSLILFEELQVKSGVEQCIHELGLLAQSQGKYDEALHHFQKSLKIAVDLGEKSGAGYSLWRLGQISREYSNDKQALAYLLNALVLFDELNLPNREFVATEIAIMLANTDGHGIINYRMIEWMKEFAAEDENISRMVLSVIQSPTPDVAIIQNLLRGVMRAAQSVLNTSLNSTPEERDELARQLAKGGRAARTQNAKEMADYYIVLRGLLLGEGVRDEAARLPEPLNAMTDYVRLQIAKE